MVANSLHGADAGALRGDGGQAAVLGRGLDHQLAADGQAEPADPVGVDVGARPQVGDRRLEVAVAAPAPAIGVAVALALAAAVEEQDAVAVPDEHARRRLRALAAREGDHRGAVARGTNQPCSSSPSLVVKLTSSCAAPRSAGGHDGAGRVRLDVLHPDGQHDEDEAERRRRRRAARGAPSGAAGCRRCGGRATA